MWRSLILVLLVLGAVVAWADGFMLPVDPISHLPFTRPEAQGFSVKYHHVAVNIDRQVATTAIDQVFHNNAGRVIEGSYIFPILDGMTIAEFAMYNDAQKLEHRILEKEKAREIYNGIVAKRQDPALLEWLGSRMISARVFPIEPNADKRITIKYQEVPAAQGGTIKYVYPLKTEKLSTQPLQSCKVVVNITSEQPILSVFSPTHPVIVTHQDERHATATYEATNVLPDQDLVLYYTVSEQNLGLSLLSYRDSGQGDGYFLMLVSPKAELGRDEIQPKDTVFVLDTSGSMSAPKLSQAKAALQYCLKSLDARDRFNVLEFNNGVNAWQTGLQTASADNVAQATRAVGAYRAMGGTNIDAALRDALGILNAAAPPDARVRPSSIVFVTDGQPTVVERNVEQILINVKNANTRKVRIFTFGVGEDYNAHFLDKLANGNNGASENVLPKDDIAAKVSTFYAKVSAPVLTNLKIDWGLADVYDLYPQMLPDLFRGAQMVIAGRYKSPTGGDTLAQIRLSGEAGKGPQIFSYDVTFPGQATADDFIPRLWATRKIGFLQDRARLDGTNKALVEEIVKLSKEFGILSEYTSFLVDLDVTAPASSGPVAATSNAFKSWEAQVDMAGTKMDGMRGAYAGGSAVAQSVNRKDEMYAMNAPSARGGRVMLNDVGERVALNRMQNVAQRSFVQNGAQWVDVHYRPAQHVVKVKAFSPAYMQLANADSRMAQYLSVSDNMVVSVKDTAVVVATEGQEAEFSPAEMEKLLLDMRSEFGPMAPPAAVTAASAAPTMGGLGAPWPLALVGVLVVGVRRRKTAA